MRVRLVREPSTRFKTDVSDLDDLIGKREVLTHEHVHIRRRRGKRGSHQAASSLKAFSGSW